MSYLVDTNVLLRIVHPSHPMYADAERAVRLLLARGEELCIIPQNPIEFWAVATRPLADNGLGLTVAQTAREVSKLKLLLKLHPDTPAIFSEWENLVIQHQVIGKTTHDARLVAAMIVHNLTHILTFNIDHFKRFSNIAAIEPQSVA